MITEIIVAAITSGVSLIICILKLRSENKKKKSKDQEKWDEQMKLNDKIIELIQHNKETIEILKENEKKITDAIIEAILHMQELENKINQ